MTTPLASADSLRIGTVDFVSPDEIKVLLDIEAPNDVSLNTGVPRPFPRINSYVLIPSESGFLVAQIEWITIERSQYPKRRGIQDFGVIDLPYPLRKMSLNPLGILRDRASDTQETSQYSFSRGIEVFPTVGDPVLLPTPNQLKSIVESGENRRVKIGVSPLAGNAVVAVDPDRLFGRHLAVLGNTGSGKSCSVAGVIRWSIEAVQRQNAGAEAGETVANTRFIILDPNGEYSSAFSDLSNVRVFGVEEDTAHGIQQLKVPLWLWNSAEWAAVTQASTKTQRPTLVQALRSVRDGQLVGEITPRDSMRRYLRTLISCVKSEISTGTPWMGGGRSKGFMENVLTWQMGFANGGVYTADELITIGRLQGKFEEFLASSTSSKPEWPKYSKPAAEELLKALGDAYHDFGGCVQDALPIDVDAPRPFAGDDLIRSIEANAELMKTSEYVETMLMRVRALLSDSKLKRVIAPEEEITLEQWMEQYICPSNSSNGAVTVLDLSLVPAELTHIVTSVVARMVLESLQRYRKMNGSKTLPTTIVMEEAHTFIKRYNSDNENATASEMCAKIFEKIAREGRKFGLGLILSSQRPSELSPTVLSQCNSFLLHRLSNDRDQELVSKLVPDNLRGLLRELPSLPSQNAILLGWASELPVLVRMNYLKEDHRPKSNDPDYWNVWIGDERTVDWKAIADDWQEV
jgi:hypothetical protein